MTDAMRDKVIKMAMTLPDDWTRTAACRFIGRELHLGYYKVAAVVRYGKLPREWKDTATRKRDEQPTTDYRESPKAKAKRLELERLAMTRCPVCSLISPCLTNHDERPDPWARRSSWTDGL